MEKDCIRAAFVNVAQMLEYVFPVKRFGGFCKNNRGVNTLILRKALGSPAKVSH